MLAELAWLLERDERVGEIHTAASGAEALKALDAHPVDVIFTDISMPGLDGLDLARVLSRFAVRPQVVFVTAYDEHAVAAFELEATDYVMKPVRPDRLAEAVRRVMAGRLDAGGASGMPGPEPPSDETIPVELGGVTTFVQRSQNPLRPGAGRLCPAAHRQGLAPGADLAQRARGALGGAWVRAHSPLHAGVHPPHHRGDHQRWPLSGPSRRRQRARGEPTAYPGAA